MVLDTKLLRYTLLAAAALIVLAFALTSVFRGSEKDEPSTPDWAPADLGFVKVSFNDLEGWNDDQQSEAVVAFDASCAVLNRKQGSDAANKNENHRLLREFRFSGQIEDWREPCRKARALVVRAGPDNAISDIEARQFFERAFRPVKIFSVREDRASEAVARAERGKFTGYFEPEYRASRTRTAAFSAPVYPKPDDLIEIDLGDFRASLTGESLVGRLSNDGRRLLPYHDHASINNGILDREVRPLAWMDPNDLLFLQIQGSGRLRFNTGAAERFGYAGRNGHAYTAIGRVLAERGVMPVEDITMQSIRAWLSAATPDDAKELREKNKSYVFFRKLEGIGSHQGPLGAQGIPLYAERSLAVDLRYHMLGTPVWVELSQSELEQRSPFRRLMIAQDTGGAIKGPIRGDIFWGSGRAAGEIAGITNAEGAMVVLLPKGLVTKIPDQSYP